MAKIKTEWFWKLLIILLFINYFFITILLRDNIAVKYLRDLVLIAIMILTYAEAKVKINNKYIFLFSLLVVLFVGAACIRTTGLSVNIIFVRRYIFPILVLIFALSQWTINEKKYISYISFILRFIALISVWGVFQAWVLKDRFLMKLGYPTKYHYGLKRMSLKDSFYFGNIGIQRVSSTLSNSNVCALMLGVTILFLVSNYSSIKKVKHWQLYSIAIVFAYILTFSRANFLAMIVVCVLFGWNVIPEKVKKYIGWGIILCVAVFILGTLLGNHYCVKILGWVIDTLNGTDSSSGGRTAIWKTAFDELKQSPLGIGFGKTGAYAQTNQALDLFHCENSYLAMGLDMGWFGILAYIGLLGCLIHNANHICVKAGKQTQNIAWIIIYMMICFFFSNHIYDMEAVAYVYFLYSIHNMYQVKGIIER